MKRGIIFAVLFAIVAPCCGEVLVYKIAAAFNPTLSYNADGTTAKVIKESVNGFLVFDADADTGAVAVLKHPKWKLTPIADPNKKPDPNNWRKWPHTTDYSGLRTAPTAIVWFAGSGTNTKWLKVFGGDDPNSRVTMQTRASKEAQMLPAGTTVVDPNLKPWPVDPNTGMLLDPNQKFLQFDPDKKGIDQKAAGDPNKGKIQLARFLAWDPNRADKQPSGYGLNSITTDKNKSITEVDITLSCEAGTGSDANSLLSIGGHFSGKPVNVTFVDSDSAGDPNAVKDPNAVAPSVMLTKSLKSKNGVFEKYRFNKSRQNIRSLNGSVTVTLDKALTESAQAGGWDVPTTITNIMSDKKMIKILRKYPDVGLGTVPIEP